MQLLHTNCESIIRVTFFIRIVRALLVKHLSQKGRKANLRIRKSRSVFDYCYREPSPKGAFSIVKALLVKLLHTNCESIIDEFFTNKL